MKWYWEYYSERRTLQNTCVSEVRKWSQEQGRGTMSNDALDNCVSEIWSDTKNIIAND